MEQETSLLCEKAGEYYKLYCCPALDQCKNETYSVLQANVDIEQSELAQQTALHPNPKVCSLNKTYHCTGFAGRCTFFANARLFKLMASKRPQ